MKRKLTRKRLVFFICLAIFSLLACVACLVLGIKLDLYGTKPYIIIPTVLGAIGFMALIVFALLNIYPYANEFDKKKLKSKTFKSIAILSSLEDLKNDLTESFEFDNGIHSKVSKRSKLFSEIKYRLYFSYESDIEHIKEVLQQNNSKGFDMNTKFNSSREVDIYFVELEQLPEDIKKLEELLDQQYIEVLKDPAKVIIPVLYEKKLNKLFYYEKWSKINITLLAVATKHIKRLLKI